MYKFLIVWCVVSMPLFSLAQQRVEAIPWSSKKLEWSDFREDNSTEKYGGTMARSHWKVDVSEADTTNYLQSGIKLKVVTYFIPSLSYVRKDIVGSKSVLAHEQLHLDIAEVFARRLKKAILEEDLTIKNYQKVINKTKRKIFAKARAMQKNYDKTHKQKWQEWVDNVAAWLLELKDYAYEEIIIPLKTN